MFLFFILVDITCLWCCSTDLYFILRIASHYILTKLRLVPKWMTVCFCKYISCYPWSLLSKEVHANENVNWDITHVNRQCLYMSGTWYRRCAHWHTRLSPWLFGPCTQCNQLSSPGNTWRMKSGHRQYCFNHHQHYRHQSHQIITFINIFLFTLRTD